MKHLYIIGDYHNINGPVKIGISQDPMARIKQLQTGNNITLFFLMCQAINNAATIEKSLHELLMPFKVRGEWFVLPPATVQAVKHILWGLDLEDECDACTMQYNLRLVKKLQVAQ